MADTPFRLTEDTWTRIKDIGVAHSRGDVEVLMKLGMQAVVDLAHAQHALEQRRSGERDRARIRREAGSVVGPALRWQVLTRDGYRCIRCGRSAPDVELHVDHVWPLSKGGQAEPSNLATLCRDCNLGKGDRGAE